MIDKAKLDVLHAAVERGAAALARKVVIDVAAQRDRNKERAITADMAHELLRYDADTGEFTWLPRSEEMPDYKRFNARYAGKSAGSRHPRGYVSIHFLGSIFRAHRIAWLMHYGQWPSLDIDHANGNPSDNRIANLREALHVENMQNKRVYQNNTTGHPGIAFAPWMNKWRARIATAGRIINVGSFTTRDEAISAYVAAKAELHQFNPKMRGEKA